MVPQDGLEPPTRGLGNRCSFLLSYWGTDSKCELLVVFDVNALCTGVVGHSVGTHAALTGLGRAIALVVLSFRLRIVFHGCAIDKLRLGPCKHALAELFDLLANLIVTLWHDTPPLVFSLPALRRQGS